MDEQHSVVQRIVKFGVARGVADVTASGGRVEFGLTEWASHPTAAEESRSSISLELGDLPVLARLLSEMHELIVRDQSNA